jgi:hypothetical protein
MKRSESALGCRGARANMRWEVRGFDKRGRERVADGMTTTSKKEHPTTRQRRLGAALRDNLRRRKAQARHRANDAEATAAAEPEDCDTRHEAEADC